ncbi:hypothetical protein [Streptomyces sp. NPDC001652]|uniref:hypothetical protein n=1 Tax=Streptomyces sp. NPDC001652 TaxID=3154393 RepID=UPI003327DC1A
MKLLLSVRDLWDGGAMRRVASAVVTAWVAAVALTGCGGDGDGGPAARRTASGTPADQRVLTTDAVHRDLRAALKAGGFGQPSFAAEQSEVMRRRPCQVMGQLRTQSAPDRKATERAVAELVERGWRANEPMADGSGIGWALDRSGWELSFLSGVASGEGVGGFLSDAEQDRAEAFKGLSFYGYGKKCGQAAATASP